MAKLTSKTRKAMPAKEFALPGKKFPLNNPSHDRAAISGATRSANAGNISPAQAAQVKTQARAKLGLKKPAKKAHNIPMHESMKPYDI